MTKRNPEFGGFSACFAVRTETDLDDPDEEDEEISTHSAREDGDQMPLIQWQSSYTFQPTPPARTETYNSPRPVKPLFISTHSAREDGDIFISQMIMNLYLFQPTPPARTETTPALHDGMQALLFQPTPPARTETPPQRHAGTAGPISTHSAREDGDSNTTQKNQQFFITFPQSNHIILPQITANLPCTHPKPFSLCSFSGANPPVNSCLLQVRTKLFETSLPPAARSEYQRLFHFNPFTHPNMFNLCSVFISQVVKSKAVSLLINDICQYGF